MRTDEIALTHEIYSEHLTKINGIDVSYREIDVIACLVASKTPGEIAQFLDIDKRTVSTHIKNIKKSFNLNSTKQIEATIRDSDRFELIKNKYLQSLFIRSKFEAQLKKFSRIVKHEKPFCYEISQQDQKNVNPLINQLKSHLKYAGISARQKTTQGYKPFCEIFSSVNEDTNYALYLVAQGLTNDAIKIRHSISLESKNGIGKIIIAQQEDTILIDASNQPRKTQQTLSLENENYYFAIFFILKEIYPHSNTGQLISDFKELIKKPLNFSELNPGISTNTQHSFLKLSQSYKKWAFGGCLILFSGVGTLSLIFNNHKNFSFFQDKAIQENTPIRSELPIPIDEVLLKRPELIEKIDKKLNSQQGIQTVSLVGVVGMGGVGKTTLARQFGRSQFYSTVWELNAETKESLLNSFKDLAYALAETKEKKEEFNFIQNIQNQEEKEKQVLSFVKRYLKLKKHWLLIYDNVENFLEIRKYFPQDSLVWGVGKVLITTRDSNIQNASYIKTENVIHIEELSPLESLTLLSKILYGCDLEKLTQEQKQAALNFLKNIPPFPLDISTTAYYIKNSQITFEEYLERINRYGEQFQKEQEKFTKESTDYAKTRYGIISSSLEKIITINPEFKELLLFVCLLDSQNIPKELLEFYKDQIVVEQFLQALKKYSFIIKNMNSDSLSTCSLHRSVQSMGLLFLVNKFNLNKESQIFSSISKGFEKYIASVFDVRDFVKIKILKIHCKAFLEHKNLLNENINASISGDLGEIYLYFNELLKAEKILKESLIILEKQPIKNYAKIGQILTNLGDAYCALSNNIKAKVLLEKSLDIYRKYLPKNHAGYIQTLLCLGIANKNLNNYREAFYLFQQSLDILRRYFPTNYDQHALILSHLGNAYMTSGDYKNAKISLEKSLKFYTASYSKDKIGFVDALGFLGDLYEFLGDYEKSKELFEKSYLVYKKFLLNNSFVLSLIFLRLSNIYQKLGDFYKAKEMLEKSLAVYQKNSSENPVYLERILVGLANLYNVSGDRQKAKKILENSLSIHEKYLTKEHISSAWVSACLANVYQELGEYIKAKHLLEHSLSVYRRKKLKENHSDMSEALIYLANVYRKLHYHKQAQILYEKLLVNYEEKYGKNHIQTARILRDLGIVFLFQGNFNDAELFIRRALLIFKKHSHPESYTCLENLSELFWQKSLKVDYQRARKLKQQSLNYLKLSIEIVRKNFFIDASALTRLSNKIKLFL